MPQAVAGTTHNRLLGGHGLRHLIGRVPAAQSLLHRPVPADRSSKLRGRVYDDRIDLFLGASFLLTLPRARATREGPH